MNDLMTKSFLSYVDLKKQAMKDLEAGVDDIEMGKLNPTDEMNLSKFFEEVYAIKADMEEITNLLLNLQDLNEEVKSAQSYKILRSLRDRTNSDMVTLLRKARIIKTRLELLDKSNVVNRSVSTYKEGSPVDRTRISVTHGLRVKLKDLMNDFQSLREQIVSEHKEGLRRKYYSVTGEKPSEEMIEKMLSGGEPVQIFEGKEDLVMENQERNESVKEIQRSLVELHQLFLDMAVLVETQGEQMNNIEQNVVNAGSYISGGTKELDRAKRLKNARTWACWIGAVVLVFILVCLIAILF
ncbi:unnamed protein product [Fraxinus pennsylvanica]|uniref:t-SNARE coiled-coil homology domain-containing protein n=1 Tax=Fraxinus pennsylvanica TaxID=56036 RepID=A0AAD1Z7H2_9LAMI|nr:unnamed protein product [Fraxinus pennsylvanica]